MPMCSKSTIQTSVSSQNQRAPLESWCVWVCYDNFDDVPRSWEKYTVAYSNDLPYIACILETSTPHDKFRKENEARWKEKHVVSILMLHWMIVTLSQSWMSNCRCISSTCPTNSICYLHLRSYLLHLNTLFMFQTNLIIHSPADTFPDAFFSLFSFFITRFDLYICLWTFDAYVLQNSILERIEIFHQIQKPAVIILV